MALKQLHYGKREGHGAESRDQWELRRRNHSGSCRGTCCVCVCVLGVVTALTLWFSLFLSVCLKGDVGGGRIAEVALEANTTLSGASRTPQWFHSFSFYSDKYFPFNIVLQQGGRKKTSSSPASPPHPHLQSFPSTCLLFLLQNHHLFLLNLLIILLPEFLSSSSRIFFLFSSSPAFPPDPDPPLAFLLLMNPLFLLLMLLFLAV